MNADFQDFWELRSRSLPVEDPKALAWHLWKMWKGCDTGERIPDTGEKPRRPVRWIVARMFAGSVPPDFVTLYLNFTRGGAHVWTAARDEALEMTMEDARAASIAHGGVECVADASETFQRSVIREHQARMRRQGLD